MVAWSRDLSGSTKCLLNVCDATTLLESALAGAWRVGEEGTSECLTSEGSLGSYLSKPDSGTTDLVSF